MVEKIIDLTGTSTTSIEDAVSIAIARASVTISGIKDAVVTETRALVEDGRVTGWKVTLRVTFEIKDRLHE
ncbi:dodecin family protein [Candidatus Binatia bacterium]|jgi:flavin-binding protein dodecin|nr:dodecin family protein [Candidatus Binatia bacterium]